MGHGAAGTPGPAVSGMRRFSLLGGGVLIPGAAHAAHPLSYLTGYGAKAYPVVALTWGLLVLSIAVVVVITALVVAGTLRRRAPGGADAIEQVTIAREGGGLRWLTIGLLITVPLAGRLADLDRRGARRRQRPGPEDGADHRGHGRAVVVEGALSQRRPLPGLRHGERDPHPCRPTRAGQAHRRGCDPLVLGPGTERQDADDPGPDERDLDRGARAGPLPRPVHGVLQLAARAHGALRDRPSPGRVRGVAGRAAPPGARGGRAGPRPRRADLRVSLQHLPRRARNGRGRLGRTRPHLPDDRVRWPSSPGPRRSGPGAR